MEENFYFVKSRTGDYLLNTFPQNLDYLLRENTDKRNKITINFNEKNYTARIGTVSSDDLIVTILTINKKCIERLKFFNELLDNCVLFIRPILNLEVLIKENNNNILEEFIHNVKSINSYSIQNLFTLIPQKSLSDNVNIQKEQLKKIIKEQPYVTVDTLLKELKYSIATKVEFSVFENVLHKRTSHFKEQHDIRSVFISILQLFAEDFESNRIEISLAACERVLEIDYDSLFVSLYYIFDNAVKYCHPNTTLKIHFDEEKSSFNVSIKMVSIKINPSEIDSLSLRGYRSDIAKKININGQGIGMYRIKKTLKINNAEISINPNSFKFNKIHKGLEYEGNEFLIKFNGQQKNWF
ncbi:hypothetical protein [Chryseobacterium sp. R2A-55]|uniref:hypothetical protein n=1 Tax=Chryseobacterium sp. R2A-55 TaxID=2744445 RepID=UPI001F39ADF3|nr:hypothetical protein [Chryseobacterium sp. R2A-55]